MATADDDDRSVRLQGRLVAALPPCPPSLAVVGGRRRRMRRAGRDADKGLTWTTRFGHRSGSVGPGWGGGDG
uniref:Uncharacterized protein n=1 Tax=Oryza glumipatula TaxID=40148 RepID=A0A0D9ZDQ2_9ORYZ